MSEPVDKRFFVRDAHEDNGGDLCWELVDRETGLVVGSDGGEPEDQLLLRDWKWVPAAMNTLADELDRLRAENARLTARVAELEASLRQVVREWENDEPGTGGLTMQDAINDAREDLGWPRAKPVRER